MARIKAILRRTEGKAEIIEELTEDVEATILIGDLKILPDSYEVYLQDDLLDLTPERI